MGRALNDRLKLTLKETAAQSRPATDPSDLVPLPMPLSEGGGWSSEAEDSAVATQAQAPAETSSDEELPVGEVNAAADAKAARQRRMETLAASC